jgi:hypothetical protein
MWLRAIMSPVARVLFGLPVEVFKLMLSCLRGDAEERPDMASVHRELEAL